MESNSLSVRQVLFSLRMPSSLEKVIDPMFLMGLPPLFLGVENKKIGMEGPLI